MTRKVVSPPKDLRARAETALAELSFGGASGLKGEALLHELQVHQIELEMQNEALRQAQAELEESRDRYVDLYEFAPVGYLTLDAHDLVLEINLTGAALLGRARQLLIGNRFIRHVAEEDRNRWYHFILGARQGRERSGIDLSMQRGDGVPFHARVECVAAGKLTVRVALSDITERKRAEDEIHRLAFYDPLTQLPNRRLLQDRLGQALAGSRRSHHYGALLFLDLDNFKALNDTRGHQAGDQLLVETGRRIQKNLRAGDTVARLGGDEFLIILEDLSTGIQDAAVQTREVGEKIREALAEPYVLAGREFHCAASLGATLFFDRTESVETLLKHADLAMYKAKSAGRNTLRFFDPAMQVSLDHRSELEADLRLAIEAGQLRLHYQPQVDRGGGLIGAEALLRWTHPVHGVVPPLDFIPLAEETGLILPLGHWVLQTACEQLKRWSEMPGASELQIAVNVSARQFRQPGFVADVTQVLATTGADPLRLKIELTEGILLDDVEDASEKMSALKGLGIGLSLDDFGTGYSSLSYLTCLPLDQLKIDRSFVLNLPDSRSDAIIAQTIITMGKSLGLDVIAEGVETEAQREFLARHDCCAYQGYLFGRPMPLAEFNRLLAAE